MIRFFRRALSSWIVIGLFGIILVAFIVTGIEAPGSMGGGASGDTVAKVGSRKISSSELIQRVQLTQENLRQEQPGLDLATFVKDGGVDMVAGQLVGAAAVEEWARKQGITASKRLVDGTIASIPAFRGPTGQFDEQVFRSALAQQRVSEQQFRRDLSGDAIRRQVLMPVAGGARAPRGLVTPYASLMLDKRDGQIGVVPVSAVRDGAAPTDAQLAAFYKANEAAYTIPERRVIRYALIGPEAVAGQTTPTAAEIEAYYKQNSANYAAREIRSLSQVILPDEAAAKAFAAKLASGTSFASAAKAAGFTPADTAIGERTQQQLAGLASEEVARAAYAAPANGTTQPLRTPLGWHIVHVDAVKQTAQRPLEAVRAEIAAELGRQKAEEARTALIDRIDDEIAEGGSFDEVVKSFGLTAATTPPLLEDGIAPTQPDYKLPADVQPLLRAAFQMTADDDPAVENLGADQQALLKVAEVIPAAPRPLAEIRAQVVEDFQNDRALAKARDIARSILAKTKTGVPLAKAIADAGVRLPAPQRAVGRQIDIPQDQPVPPPVALLFRMSPGTADMVEIPGGQGFFVVQLEKIEKGNVAQMPDLVEAISAEFDGLMSQELGEQFVNALRKDVGVKQNADALSRVKRDLSGSSAQ